MLHRTEGYGRCRATRPAIGRRARPYRQGVTALAGAALWAALIVPAGAATFQVTTTDDTVAIAPATSPNDVNNSVSLRSAIMAANAQAGPDTIVLASGAVYKLTIGPADSALGALDASRGDLDITDALTLLGNGATLDAGGLDRALSIERADLQDFAVAIERLTVKGGAPKGFLSPGGGISVRAATLDLSDCVLTGNSTIEPGSTDNGGGIAANGVRDPELRMARLNLRGCTISGNAANNGGGIVAGDCLLTVSESRVQENKAVGLDAGSGGGNVFLVGSATTADIADSVISGGTGSADGGGLSLFSAALTMERSTVAANLANGYGGGLFDSPISPGATTVAGVTFEGNQADRNADGTGDGGGLFVSGAASLVNATLSGNSAIGGGGLAGRGEALLRYVTVAGNTAQTGGGLLPVTVKISNSLIATNSAAVGPDAAGALLSGGHNLIGKTLGLALAGDATGNRLDVDAKIAPLADNGGPTRTHALLPGSPALDGASSADVPTTDQRGIFRPQDGDGNGVALADIGAFEWVPPYTLGDAAQALRIAGGLSPGSIPDVFRLDVGNGNEQVDLADTLRLARKAAGSESNP